MRSRRSHASTEPGKIVVRSGTAEHQGQHWVVVEITDDGPGVPQAFIDRIFEPFFTTARRRNRLRIYLAAELIKEQSGRLTVHNNHDGGATFTIWLPRSDRPASDQNVGHAPA